MKFWGLIFLCLSSCKCGYDIVLDSSLLESGNVFWPESRQPVGVKPYKSDPLFDIMIETEMDYWNNAVGRQVFMYNNKGKVSFKEDAGAVEKRGPAVNAFTELELDHNKKIDKATVFYHAQRLDGTSYEKQQEAIRHELGHVLGLWHTKDPHNLMFGGGRWPSPTLSEDQLSFLEGRYAHP